MTMSVSRSFHMLSEIINWQERRKVDCLSIAEVVNMNVEIASNDEFMRGGAAWERNDENLLTLWTPSYFLPNFCRRRLNFSHTTARRRLHFR